jgi:methionyl-tRNA formyltransferase
MKKKSLNVVLFTIEDPFYFPKFIKELIVKENIQLSLVVFPKGFFSLKRVFITFFIYGLIRFIKTVLIVIINGIQGGKIKKILKKNKIEYLEVENLNNIEFTKRLNDIKPDLILSYNCSQKFSKEILRIPKKKSINFHLGLLPKYRGLFPILNALINNEKEIGVTVHYMDEKFDNGKIILQERIVVGKNDNLFSLYDKAFEAGNKIVFKSLEMIFNDTVHVKDNNSKEASYFSYPSLYQVLNYHFKRFYKKFM